ncbi:MAG: AAA family ATPase, partial [Bryobacterales bacterium]|nr:AAA family ATPase [Bryobacterales bacterium]
MIANQARFHSDSEQEKSPIMSFEPPKEAILKKYQVNVIVDNAGLQGAPVIVEMNPTYSNLFGRIEQEARFGALTTDFTLVRGGALQRANGGYLVLPVEETLRNPLSWEALSAGQQLAVES